ncbi:MAG: hypothetical protein ACLRMN_00210 [Mediterraneibacter gnavus]
MFKVDVQDPYVNDEVSVISAIREIKDYQIIPSERLGYVQVQVPMEIFQNAFSKVLADGTECYILKKIGMNPFLLMESHGNIKHQIV